MNKSKLKFESGVEYTIKQLFNGDNKIVIPDLQRDYCWGDKAWNEKANNYTELVSGFLDSLLLAFNENRQDKLLLGLIYGYESPHYTIQLCDGQQRLTTLFLLMGMINRKTDKNQFQHILISKSELLDDREPNLQYAIRESTLYFLSDLVCEFFLNNNVKIEQIKKESWYFKEYDLDASIQSVINAIKTIDNKLINIDINSFGEFVLNNLQMIYYDMGHRTRGEETFVVINTTGEPLTATENLKPILIGKIENEKVRGVFSKEWEEREEWFWTNRSIKEHTSDSALNDFFIWYWQICLLQEKSWKDKKSYPLNPIQLFQKRPINLEGQEENPDINKWEESRNLDAVHKYFIALKTLVDKCNDSDIEKVLKTIHNEDISLSWFRKAEVLEVTLPLIAYVVKFGAGKNLYKFIRRIRKNFFDKKWAERKENYLDWRHIIQIIEFSEKEEDVLKYKTIKNHEKFKNIPNITLNEWYTQEEKLKDEFLQQQAQIEIWEDHEDFMGDLSFLISINSKQNYICSFEDLQKQFQNYSSVIDLIKKREEKPISNTYRLFLFYIDCEQVEHKPRVSWDIEGVLFSTIGRNHLDNDQFKKMCNQDPSFLEEYCLKFIVDKIDESNLFDLSENNFTTGRALKCWLTLKVFNANNKNLTLSYFDGNNSQEGVSIYRDFQKNKLIESEQFSVNNMICGFGVMSGAGGSYIAYSDLEKADPVFINSAFASINNSKENRTLEQLETNKINIDLIINSIKK